MDKKSAQYVEQSDRAIADIKRLPLWMQRNLGTVEVSEHEPLDVAWVAGFFDGEGSVSIQKYNNTCRLHIGIEQNIARPLVKIQEMFGGSVHKRSTRKTFILSIGTEKAEIFLKTIFPYLIVKKEDARIALEFRKLIGTRGRGKLSPDIYNEMINLREKLINLHNVERV